MRNLEELPLPFRAGAPIRLAAVTGDDQVAVGCGNRVDGEHAEASDEIVLSDVAGRSFDELGAPDLSTRFTGDNRIAPPPIRTENFSADRLVEMHSAGGLMLRGVVKHARLIDDVRKVLGMARRKAVVAAFLDLKQFVKWIAVGKPGGSFLVSA